VLLIACATDLLSACTFCYIFTICVVTMKNKFITGLFTLLLAFSSVYGTDSLTKEERWDNMTTLVASWTDGLGLPIDDGIKDTVIAVNLLDIPTTGSCEGHLHWGTNSPWVELDLSTSQELIEELEANKQLIETARLTLQEQHPDLSWDELYQMPVIEPLHKLFRERYKIIVKIEAETLARVTPLLNSLAAFYETHSCSYDCKLTLVWYGSTWCRLESEGARWQNTKPDQERAEKLATYQQEMNAFTQFLKANLN
jgi:hypothetical protein